jgi:hypothetical protein
MVTGNDRPPTLNTELVELTAVTVTAAPLAVRLPEALPLVPTTTLPSVRVAGVTDNCPVAAVPVPDNGTTKVESDALEIMVTSPVTAPAEVGVNETLKVVLCPEFSVIGVETPLTLNPGPLAVT